MSSRAHAPGAPRRLATRMVERAGLTPPVPVDELLAAVATVRMVPLPGSCEATLVRGEDGRPEALVRDTLAHTPRRLRFTLAHLLGHATIGWHVGPTCCHTHPDALGDLTTVDAIIESEASAFAMELLAPTAWLSAMLRPESPSATIARVAERAGVPLPIAARAAARLLPPGLVWAIADEHRYVHFSGMSPGTLAPLPARGMPLDTTEVARRAMRRESLHAGERTLWCWLLETDGVHHETSAVLLDAIAADLRIPPPQRQDLFGQVHGVAGFASERLAVVPAGELEQELGRRLRTRDQLAPLTTHRLFEDYVHARAGELVGRRVGW